MGFFKALKRLPWRKIAKYGAAAVGLPVIATSTGANEEIAQAAGSSAITEHILIVIQSVLGLLTVIVEERRKKARDGQPD